jgi:hypothetical protein
LSFIGKQFVVRPEQVFRNFFSKRWASCSIITLIFVVWIAIRVAKFLKFLFRVARLGAITLWRKRHNYQLSLSFLFIYLKKKTTKPYLNPFTWFCGFFFLLIKKVKIVNSYVMGWPNIISHGEKMCYISFSCPFFIL